MSNENAFGPINLATLGKLDDDGARALLERIRWPLGPICPHCGVLGEATRMERHADAKSPIRSGLLNCRACREPFSVTVGTIFEGSHIPLAKWLVGFLLMASSKKGVSALQLQRQLGLGSYRSAWHMAHRIRHAMQNDPSPEPLRGIVEVDETYVGGKPRRYPGEAQKGKLPPGAKPRKRGRGSEGKVAVQVLVQRDGGGARARAVQKVDATTLKPYIRAHVEKSAAIHSDEFQSYKGLAKDFDGGHETVAHAKGEYAREGVHSNTAESFNGLFKRAVMGSWHHISREHIDRYLDEQVFRWSHRKTTDTERTLAALGRVDGVRLYYRKPKGQAAGGGAGLVAGQQPTA